MVNTQFSSDEGQDLASDTQMKIGFCNNPKAKKIYYHRCLGKFKNNLISSSENISSNSIEKTLEFDEKYRFKHIVIQLESKSQKSIKPKVVVFSDVSVNVFTRNIPENNDQDDKESL